MLTPHYSFDAGKFTGSPFTASEINHLLRVVESQAPFALRALGVGVIADDIHEADRDEIESLQVYLSGGNLYVSPGAAIVHETVDQRGFCGVVLSQTTSVTDLSDAENGTNYLYAVAEYSYEDDPINAALTDAREGAPPQFAIYPTDGDVNAGVLLASFEYSGGTISNLTDRREFHALMTLSLRIAQLERDLGYDETARGKGTVSDRLDALTGEDSESPVVSFLSQLKYSEADPRNAITVIEEKLADILAAALDAASAGGDQRGITENDEVWNWVISLRNVLGISAPNLLRLVDGAGAQPGLHGTESAPSTEQFDVGGTLPPVPEEREYDSR